MFGTILAHTVTMWGNALVLTEFHLSSTPLMTFKPPSNSVNNAQNSPNCLACGCRGRFRTEMSKNS